ncbi:uncharacterized protein LOC126297536 [Schistocerca gregaria]|uniref:uncharacterized protein LOC126297536 n=1 Tax=Schistocerca gregaria TaxID=7010 RepID=UPI00211EDF00|nr:uncharacterized protein LOC126297536 [Schistocerca gregaria]
MSRFILLLALLIPGDVARATAEPEVLTCFHCGDEEQDGEPPCNTQPPQVATCPEANYCLKILFQNGSVQRGCAPRATAWGRRVLVGCVEPARDDTSVLRYCACDTHLCNRAQPPPTDNLLLLFLLFWACLLFFPGGQ